MTVGKQITKGALYIAVGKLAVLLIYVVNVTLIPRFLGPESMGFYSYWLSVYFVSTTILNFGAASILMRYLPELRKTHEEAIRPLIKKILQIKFPLIFLVILGGAFLFPGERMFFYTILLASVFYSIISVEKIILYAYKDMKKYSLVDFSRISIRLLFILLLFVLFRDSGILLAILLSTLLVSLIYGFFALKLIPGTSETLASPFRDYLTFGLFIYLADIFSILAVWLVVIISRRYTNSMAMVGFLGLGIQICFSVIVNLMYFLGESIFPSLVEFHVTDDVRFIKSLEANWKYTNLILIPLICGLFILAKPTVAIVIGEKYLPSVKIIRLLLPATVFMIWGYVYKQILFIFKRKVTLFLAQLARFIAFISTIFFFIKNWGIVGASLSVLLGAFVAFIYVYLAASRIERIPSQLPHVFRPILSSAVMCIVIGFINIGSPAALIGTILLGMLVYFAVMLLIRGVTGTDIQRLKGVFQ